MLKLLLLGTKTPQLQIVQLLGNHHHHRQVNNMYIYIGDCFLCFFVCVKS